MTRLRRLLWYLRRSCSSRWSLSRGFITSTVCGMEGGPQATKTMRINCLETQDKTCSSSTARSTLRYIHPTAHSIPYTFAIYSRPYR